MDDKKNFAILLNYLINTRSNGRTKKELAKEIGVDAKTLRFWLNGDYSPQRNKYKDIAKALNITTGVFFTELDFLIDKDGNIQTHEIEEHLKAPFKFNNYVEESYHCYDLFDKLEDLVIEIAKEMGYFINGDDMSERIKLRGNLNLSLLEIFERVFPHTKKILKKEKDVDYLLFQINEQLEDELKYLETLNSNDQKFLLYMKQNNVNIEQEKIACLANIEKLKSAKKTLEVK